jgi:phosphatidylserine decarboxylase
MEKGRFELAGSTIVLLFQKNRIRLLPHIQKALADGQEVRVVQGVQIGEQVP